MTPAELTAITAGVGLLGGIGGWFIKSKTTSPKANGLGKDIAGAIKEDGNLTRQTMKEEGVRTRENIQSLVTAMRGETELAMLRAVQAGRQQGAA